MFAKHSRPMFRHTRSRLQILFGIREFQLHGLHHREVFRECARPKHTANCDGCASRGLREQCTISFIHSCWWVCVAEGAGRLFAHFRQKWRIVQFVFQVERHRRIPEYVFLVSSVRFVARRKCVGASTMVRRCERLVARSRRLHEWLVAKFSGAEKCHERRRLGSQSKQQSWRNRCDTCLGTNNPQTKTAFLFCSNETFHGVGNPHALIVCEWCVSKN